LNQSKQNLINEKETSVSFFVCEEIERRSDTVRGTPAADQDGLKNIFEKKKKNIFLSK